MTGTDVAAVVAGLADREAVQVLALVVDHAGPVPGDDQLRQLEERLHEAVGDSDLAGFLDPATLPAVPPDQPLARAGDLARTTLAHLAATPERADVVRRAVSIAATDTTRFVDPGTLAVGALVLLALQTEIELTRSSTGRWHLRVHKPALSDSALGQVLARLVSLFRRAGP